MACSTHSGRASRCQFILVAVDEGRNPALEDLYVADLAHKFSGCLPIRCKMLLYKFPGIFYKICILLWAEFLLHDAVLRPERAKCVGVANSKLKVRLHADQLLFSSKACCKI